MCKMIRKNGFWLELRQIEDSGQEEGQQQWIHEDDLLGKKFLIKMGEKSHVPWHKWINLCMKRMKKMGD